MSIIRETTLKAQGHLKEDEVLLLIGARQAGKTTLLRQLDRFLKEKGATTHFLNLEDPEYLELLNASPKNLFKLFPFDLKKKTTVFIDEVQYLSNPTNFLKYLYDEYRGRIKIVASGSSAFYIDRKFKDSLAGRKRIVTVLTLSFRDFLVFKGEGGLAKRDFGDLTLSEKEKVVLSYREYLIFGGYPRVVLAPLEEKREVLQDIAYSYVKKDIFEAGVRQEETFYKLFKILSAQIGNLVNANELAGTLGVSKTSIDSYLTIMQKSFHLHLIRPFSKNIRKELTRMPKVYFLDLGLRNFFVNNFNSYDLREDKGPLLENAVYRQLLDAQNRKDTGEIRFWRTVQKDEIDFIVGEKRAFEVKSQPTQFKERHYRTFLDHYPDINLCIATLDGVQGKIGRFEVVEAWKI